MQQDWIVDTNGINVELDDEVILFGYGFFGKMAEFLMKRSGIRILAIFDNAADSINHSAEQRILYPFKCDKSSIQVVVSVSDQVIREGIVSQLSTLGYERIAFVDSQRITKAMPDKEYVEMRFFQRIGKRLDLNNPVTFNEKLNWLKIYDRKPIYTMMVDKYAVKELVSERIGAKYVIPCLGVWNTFDEIDRESLPKQFVLKCNHDCGSVVICKDKDSFDWEAARRKLSFGLERNYFWEEREWPYKDVQKHIFCEEYIDSDRDVLDVYKVINIMGEPRIIQVIQDDKTENETIDYFDTDWNLLDLRQNYPNSKIHLKKPEKLEELLELSRKLSRGMQQIRTDFYIVGKKILFSEYTFYSDSGFEPFYPDEWDEKLGNMIVL